MYTKRPVNYYHRQKMFQKRLHVNPPTRPIQHKISTPALRYIRIIMSLAAIKGKIKISVLVCNSYQWARYRPCRNDVSRCRDLHKWSWKGFHYSLNIKSLFYIVDTSYLLKITSCFVQHHKQTKEIYTRTTNSVGNSTFISFWCLPTYGVFRYR